MYYTIILIVGKRIAPGYLVSQGHGEEGLAAQLAQRTLDRFDQFSILVDVRHLLEETIGNRNLRNLYNHFAVNIAQNSQKVNPTRG